MICASDILNIDIAEREKDIQEIKVNKFHNICRICLLEGEITNIFELHYDGHFISDLIFYCCSVQVIRNDEYPQNICASCINQLLISFQYIYKCCNSDELLKFVLSQEKLKPKEEAVTKFTSDKVVNEKDNHPDVLIFKRETNRNNNSLNTNEIQIDVNGEICDTFNIAAVQTDIIRRDSSCESVNGRLESKYKNELKSEDEEEENKRIFVCQVCGDKYNKLDDLKLHHKVMKHSRPRKFICSLCSKGFPCKAALNQHMRTHTKEKPYQCELCFTSFSVSRNLKRHIMIHTGEKPYTCDICGKGFNQRVTLKGHKRIHTGERPFICNYCGKSLKYSSELKAHIDRHLVEQEENDLTEDTDENVAMKLECNICKEIVSSRRGLRLHKSISHGKKSQLCCICGKGFVGKQGLLSHMKTHTGEKPFCCQFCNKTFAHRMTLKDHEFIHTGEKPHVCSLCGKRFIQHHHLTHHLRTHTGEKPYICPFCDRAFALKGNLTVHVRTHTGETPYTCSFCDVSFYDSSSLRKHKRIHMKTVESS